MWAARILAGLFALSFAAATLADETARKEEGGFWWGGLDLGVASISRTYSITPQTRDTVFSMAFRGGYAWHPRLLVGIELGGWLLEAGNYNWAIDENAKGEGIQTLYAIAQYYPREGSPLFLKAGFGNVRYWNNRPQEDGASGDGGVIGAGYDYALGGSWFATPAIEFAWGKFDGATSPPGITQDQRYNVVTFKVGITYR